MGLLHFGWVFSLGLWLLLGCSDPPQPPEASLEQTLSSMLGAIEARSPEPFLRHISPEIQTEDGLGYADIDSLVLTQLLRHQTLGARFNELRIVPTDSAEVFMVLAQVSFSTEERLLDDEHPPPTSSVQYAFEVRFRKLLLLWQAEWARYRKL